MAKCGLVLISHSSVYVATALSTRHKTTIAAYLRGREGESIVADIFRLKLVSILSFLGQGGGALFASFLRT